MRLDSRHRPVARLRPALVLAALAIAPLAAQPSFLNRSVPSACHAKMVEYLTAGHTILCVAFPPAGGDSWSVITDRAFFNRNVPAALHAKMVELRDRGEPARFVAFPPAGGDSWSVLSDQGFYNRHVPVECHAKMQEYLDAGHRLRCVAFPPGGGNAWSIVTDRTYFNRNVPTALQQQMGTSVSLGDRPWAVAFPPTGTGAWALLTERSAYHSGIPLEAMQVLASFVADPGAAQCVAFPPVAGAFSVIARYPVPSLDPVPTVWPNVTSASFPVTGRNLDLVVRVQIGSTSITRTDPSDPTQAYFRRVSRTELRVHAPQGLPLGGFALRAATPHLVSEPRTVSFSRPATPTLLMSPLVAAGQPLPTVLSAGFTEATSALLVVSTSATPSSLPGIVDLALGGNFTALFVLEPALAVSPFTWAARTDLPTIPALSGTILFAQAVLPTMALPLATTNRVATTIF